MKYLIVQAWDSEYPNFKTDVSGKPLAFTDLSEAEANKETLEKIIEIN